jgi:hypothetical protein
MADAHGALLTRFPDLFVVQLNDGTWQICDGCGRDGFVLASNKSQKVAVEQAYNKYCKGRP